MTIQAKDITLSFVSENRLTGKVTRQVDADAATGVATVIIDKPSPSVSLGYTATVWWLDEHKVMLCKERKPVKGKGPRNRWGQSK
jgi:hypothetical protein